MSIRLFVRGPVALPSAPTIPLSFNDAAFFSGNTIGTPGSLSIGASLAQKTFATFNAGDQQVTMLGNNTLSKISIYGPSGGGFATEGLRIAGGGFFNIDGCWLETAAISPGHSDAIQAFSPGDTGTLTITNTTIRAWTAEEVSPPYDDGSQGLFIADNWTGAVVIHNVVFWGSGNYACRIYADVGGDTHIDFQNVYFVGPFNFGPYDIRGAGGHVIVTDRWENVVNATIVGGVLIPGTPLPPP